MNPLEHRIINQIVALNALNRGVALADRYKGSGFSGVALADRYKFPKGLADCGCDGGLGDAPAGAAADYVCAGSRIIYNATVQLNSAGSGGGIQAVETALQSKGVAILNAATDGGVLSNLGLSQFTISIDCVWPIDMAHISDVSSVIDSAVYNAGMTPATSSVSFVQNACKSGATQITGTGLPPENQVDQNTSGSGSSCGTWCKIALALGVSGTMLAIGGAIVGVFLIKELK